MTSAVSDGDPTLAMLAHPLLILMPAGLFVVTDWGNKAMSNPAAHGFSEVLYEFSSASANNGSGFEGLGDTYGFNDADKNPSPPAPYAVHWDIATGLTMLLGRFIPIIAPIANRESPANATCREPILSTSEPPGNSISP